MKKSDETLSGNEEFAVISFTWLGMTYDVRRNGTVEFRNAHYGGRWHDAALVVAHSRGEFALKLQDAMERLGFDKP